MAALRSVRHLCLIGATALLGLSVACRLDMLLKPTGTPVPVLTLTPAEVQDTARAHSGDEKTAAVAITNSGGGSFTWSATDRSDWIRIDPREGEVPGTLTLTLDPEDLGPGVYQGEVTVVGKSATDSQTATIAVTFVVQRPGLNVTPTSMDRSTTVASNQVFNETLQISNNGTGQLSWTAAKDKPWITLGATSGTGDASLAVAINSSGLAGGTYTGEIVISAPGATGSPARVAVILTVLAPGLAVSPGAIHESAPAGSTTPVNTTLRVTNSGNGTITWTATKTAPWLTMSATTGGAPADVVVTLNPTGLPPGMQRDTIVFTSPEALNGPVKVGVDFNITQAGLSVAPGSINATAESNDQKTQDFDLSITNSGGGALAWFATSNTAWIAVSPLGGIAPATLKVTIDPRGLGAGTHSGSVTVSSPGAVGSPVTVPVQLTITRKVCNEIALNPDETRNGTLDANDCEAPHRPGSFANWYGFSASAGDGISIRMTASFDAYLYLVDGAGNVLTQNDECPGESGTACVVNFPITSEGRYFIEATSTNPRVSGQLTLSVVRERAPSPPQDLRQLQSDGATAIGVGGTTPEDQVVFRGRISDPNDGDDRLEVELEPLGSPFTGAATHIGDFVAVSGGGTQTLVRATGLTNNTGYHWQVRTCDRTGRCSAWLQFGNNAETDADFSVAVPPGGSPPKQQ